jgi:gliding motility associated protien GldN
MRIVLSLIIAVFALSANAQVNYSEFITSGEHTSYQKVAVKERPIIGYPPLREADVKFSRRIVRCIDVRQKMNKQLEWPREPLNRLLYQSMSKGEIVPYKNDSLMSFYNTEEFTRRGGEEVITFISTDPDDPTIGKDSVYYEPYKYEKIKKYYLLEDWIFDYKHSVFKPRIIAIAPIFAPSYGGQTGKEQPLCWIKMDEIRQLLSNTEMFNRYNDAARMSFDDFFQMRMFDSYIVYESNVYDNYIAMFQEYENDASGALLKSDEIKNDLFIFEHDLWQY